MIKRIFKTIFLLQLCILYIKVIAQSNDHITQLRGDTLVTASGKIIMPGQPVVIGKGKGENGWYRSIGFKNMNSLLLLLNPQNYFTYNYSGSSDAQEERRNDLVVTMLPPGDTAFIKTVPYTNNKRYSNWYNIELVRKGFPKIRFTCNADTALKYEEIIIP